MSSWQAGYVILLHFVALALVWIPSTNCTVFSDGWSLEIELAVEIEMSVQSENGGD
jgi:low affinity Fe/Cu permease